MYAVEAFERYGADAVTVNPYMGMDAIKPFLDYADKGVVVLCRTSNAGAKEIQELKLENGMELYKHVASLIAGPWNLHGNNMLVAGATYPEELGEIRKIVGKTPLLVPGIGAQGGDLAGVLKYGLTEEKTGLVINSSRGIIYASSEEDFAQKRRSTLSADFCFSDRKKRLCPVRNRAFFLVYGIEIFFLFHTVDFSYMWKNVTSLSSPGRNPWNLNPNWNGSGLI